jgi:hypothetical protein
MKDDLSDKKHVYDLKCACGHQHSRSFIVKPISFLSTCPVCGKEEKIVSGKRPV